MINDTVFHISHIKRDFSEINHQQGANLKSSSKYIEFTFAVNNNYYQTSNVYLELEVTLKLNGDNFDYDNTGTTRL